ncbi:selenoprotein O [Croceicoccus estronivorus]|uniref:protein adenylyltransferase SelO family protein n=1 Tax=Croceicoccus estronivorus TaxID=1172626 RepID=UPI000833B578|nr:YdiU family protein [Croceicoccus estronivorus]OCC24956.1 selenoprotein O [Croceicoccus estronivorus]
MRAEPQAAPYSPDPQILRLAEWLGDPVHSADFPETKLRYRNRRWDKAVGLADLTDEQWVAHFARFQPLPDNLPEPLALRYHGHQFRVFNPEIGDGRGFLFGQLRDGSGRLLDLGTKGSGQTPYSRSGDGRLTLKGAVREILATEMLEALGCYTSKTFSVVETGEELWRNDEPSPTRSAVLVRLSHGHIRIGTFQRLAALEETASLEQLVSYCLEQYPGNLPPDDAPGRHEPAVILLHQVVERLADLAAAYVTSGFVHGVLNTDNMNISGESFDYGPWRWLPQWEMDFTAAYFDHTGLYAFGRQVEALSWNCAQLGIALRPLADSAPLIAALERFGPLYQENLVRRFLWRLGITPLTPDKDVGLVATVEATMRERKASPDAFFFDHRGGRNANGALASAFRNHHPLKSDHPYWTGNRPETMLIDEVEEIWSLIDRHDDWTGLEAKVAAIRRMGDALGEPPAPASQPTERVGSGR